MEGCLLKAEKDLVRLLLVASDKVILKIEFEIECRLKKKDPFNLRKNYQILEKKHDKYRSYLKEIRVGNGKSSNKDTSQIP